MLTAQFIQIYIPGLVSLHFPHHPPHLVLGLLWDRRSVHPATPAIPGTDTVGDRYGTGPPRASCDSTSSGGRAACDA